MVFQDSQKTIEKLYEMLDFQPGENLATMEAPTGKVYEETLLAAANRKLGIESIFFYRPPNGGTSTPYIYFRRLEGQNHVQVSAELAGLHKLAWNMGRAPLLFAALPNGQTLIYNTCVPPTELKPDHPYQTGLIQAINIFSQAESERKSLLTYHRREFESGRYWRENSSRFDPKKRADQTLLEYLKFIRRKLLGLLAKDAPLEAASEIVHSLLGRAIFVKYLEDRKDSSQNNVFPPGFFGQFKPGAARFTDVLSDKKATYELFEYFNKKFNGDIFPVGEAEKKHIKKDHLTRLASFLTGQERLTGQLGLWKFYSFDAIPIEFISSIYEEFFHIRQKESAGAKSDKTGTHYTPHHLVEFLVDEVFPWEGTETGFKVLDPACGSGIFLVEIYRRLIARWHQANPAKKITPDQLKKLLTDNIFGVDLNLEAIRVAAFSLYLTLCDYLEPRQIWEKVKFPELRHKNFYPTDFFEENQLFSSQSYDLIIGNPPWQSELTVAAERYRNGIKADFPEREVAPDNQIALAFLWRAAAFCKSSGEICLLMPSKGLLFNRSGPHQTFRRDFFAAFHIKTIINFSAFRHLLFEKGAGPGAAVFYLPQKPDATIPVLYCSPKPTHAVEDKWRVTIEPQDIAQLPRAEAIESDIIWKVAMWGGPRDFELIKKLMASPYRTLREVCDDKRWMHGEGVTVGNKKYDASWFLDKPYVDARALKRFVMDEGNLPSFDKPKLENLRNKTRAIFYGPHIILKQSPVAGEHNFRAALLRNIAVFRHSLIGINGHKSDMNLLARCCIVLNSRVHLYFALMSSRRWLVERDELEKDEIMSFPMPPNLLETSISFNDLKRLACDSAWETKVENLAEKLYDFTEDERILVDDAINYTLSYFRLKTKSAAAKQTFSKGEGERILEEYLHVLKRVLQNSFGKSFEPIIFQGNAPLRVAALRLLDDAKVSAHKITLETSHEALEQALNEVNKFLIEQRSPNVFIRRNVRGYIGRTIYIIKPDQRRYWTRANALRDADEIYAEIMEAWRPSI